jgi:FtsP/CotA-like multicopper oxidase with cupredoxin domain
MDTAELLNRMKLSRRDLIKLGAMSGAATLIGSRAWAQTCIDQTPMPIDQAINTSCGVGGEAMPLSPFILNPFQEELPGSTFNPLNAMRPGWRRWTGQPGGSLEPNATDAWTVRTPGSGSLTSPPSPGPGRQDAFGVRSRSSTDPVTGRAFPLPDAGTHQLWTDGSGVSAVTGLGFPLPNPILYHIRLQVGTHRFTSSPVRTLAEYFDRLGNRIPAGTTVSRLPDSTIYGFNGTFPGPRINAEYGKPCLVRFENDLDHNPLCLDRQDFGAPDWAFLTHLHNGHTAPESDGQPHHLTENEGGYQPQEWVDNLYLNWPAGGDPAEMQSFLWFHDHRMHHTGANVYKGMVGLFPIYDPVLDPGDETSTVPTALHLPGRRVNNADGTFDVKYDIPMALYDVALDDGAIQHQDQHMVTGCGAVHPEWWGKQFFRHYPNSGFVGDIFTINGAAYPVLHVYQRKYRLRFLDASVSRIYQLWLMKSSNGPVAAPGTKGQWQMPDGQQSMKFTQIASEGGLLPAPIVRNSFEIWPAKRREFVVDFTRHMDGSPTTPTEVLWLVNTARMDVGREPNNPVPDPNVPNLSYAVPMMKIVIVGPPPETDVSTVPSRLRLMPPAPRQAQVAIAPKRTFTLQRGSTGSPETEWLINGLEFNPLAPLALPVKGAAEVWTIANGGGGWVHPMHLHMEEHRVLSRKGVPAPDALHPDDTGKEDVIALYPSESIVLWRKFRTFKGKYVAHCHNLAHEDHNMMFGWTIV